MKLFACSSRMRSMPPIALHRAQASSFVAIACYSSRRITCSAICGNMNRGYRTITWNFPFADGIADSTQMNKQGCG